MYLPTAMVKVQQICGILVANDQGWSIMRYMRYEVMVVFNTVVPVYYDVCTACDNCKIKFHFQLT